MDEDRWGDQTERLSIEGCVVADGDCIYVTGMILANILKAAFPARDGRDGHYNYGRLTITIEKEAPSAKADSR